MLSNFKKINKQKPENNYEFLKMTHLFSLKNTYDLYITPPIFQRGKSVRSWCDGLLDRSFIVEPLRYFSYNKGVAKAEVCAILSVGYKITLAANRKEQPMWLQRVSSIVI